MHPALKNILIVAVAAAAHFGLLFGSAIAVFIFGNPLGYPPDAQELPLWERVVVGFTEILSQPGSYIYEEVFDYAANGMVIAGLNSLLWGIVLFPLIRFLLKKRRQRIDRRLPAPNAA